MAALIGVGEETEGVGSNDGVQREPADDLDGVPIFDDRPIDFSGGAGLDGMPMVCSGTASLINLPPVENRYMQHHDEPLLLVHFQEHNYVGMVRGMVPRLVAMYSNFQRLTMCP